MNSLVTAPSAVLVALLATTTPLHQAHASSTDEARSSTRQEDTPEISLSRAIVAFGTLEVDDRVELSFAIENTGAAPLILSELRTETEMVGLRFDNRGLPASFEELCREHKGAMIVPAGATREVKFYASAFEAEPGPYASECTIVTNDPRYPELRLPISLYVAKKSEPAASPHRQGAAPLVPPTLESLVGNPRSQIEASLIALDFGDVLCGAEQRRSTTLRNAGLGDLVIEKIRTSCGCAVAGLRVGDREYGADELKHGLGEPVRLRTNETAELEVTFVAPTELGSPELTYDKHVFVYTNDPLMNPARIAVHASVVNRFERDADRLRFGAITRRDAPTLRTRFHAGELEFGVESVRVDHPELFAAELQVIEDAEGATAYELSVSIRPGCAPGFFGTTVHLALDHDQLLALTVPVDVSIEADVQFHCESELGRAVVDFGDIEAGGAGLAVVTIRNRDPDHAYALTSIELQTPRGVESIEHQVVEVEAGVEYRIELRASGVQHTFQGRLVVHGDHPECPKKMLPFVGRLAAPAATAEGL